MNKKVYMSPVCTVNEIASQSMMAQSPLSVNNEPMNNVGGDVNFNEGLDIWSDGLGQ